MTTIQRLLPPQLSATSFSPPSKKEQLLEKTRSLIHAIFPYAIARMMAYEPAETPLPPKICFHLIPPTPRGRIEIQFRQLLGGVPLEERQELEKQLKGYFQLDLSHTSFEEKFWFHLQCRPFSKERL